MNDRDGQDDGIESQGESARKKAEEILRSEKWVHYLRLYDTALNKWPPDRKSFTVPTRFGETQCHSCGVADGIPVILLHGMGGNATGWHACVGALGETYRVIALDTMGDVGRSIPERTPKNGAEFADWIADVMDGLDIDRAHLVGLSFGG